MAVRAPEPDEPLEPDEPDEPPDEDDVTEDWEMRFARDLVSSVSASTRPKLAAGAQKLVTKVRGDEEVEYDGEKHSAAYLFDALKEGYYGKF